jgi:hypothetical protein
MGIAVWESQRLMTLKEVLLRLNMPRENQYDQFLAVAQCSWEPEAAEF